MMILPIEVLVEQIDLLKKDLIKIAKETGLNSHETIRCSRKLDQFIMIYQKYGNAINKKKIKGNQHHLLSTGSESVPIMF